RHSRASCKCSPDKDLRTVTQESVYWLLPTSLKGVSYYKVRNIDFSAAKTLKNTFFQIYLQQVGNPLYCQFGRNIQMHMYQRLWLQKLLKRCNDINIEVSEEEVSNVEKATKKQSEENLWYDFRAGRITASKIENACHTDPNKFSNLATRWGLSKETVARSTLLNILIGAHENVELEDSGLCISTDCPHVAASPDGIIT
ncbi:hypothetical protein MAR_029789, partial [Mya arenaria]